jgi:hypothetical protein
MRTNLSEVFGIARNALGDPKPANPQNLKQRHPDGRRGNLRDEFDIPLLLHANNAGAKFLESKELSPCRQWRLPAVIRVANENLALVNVQMPVAPPDDFVPTIITLHCYAVLLGNAFYLLGLSAHGFPAFQPLARTSSRALLMLTNIAEIISSSMRAAPFLSMRPGWGEA